MPSPSRCPPAEVEARLSPSKTLQRPACTELSPPPAPTTKILTTTRVLAGRVGMFRTSPSGKVGLSAFAPSFPCRGRSRRNTELQWQETGGVFGRKQKKNPQCCIFSQRHTFVCLFFCNKARKQRRRIEPNPSPATRGFYTFFCFFCFGATKIIKEAQQQQQQQKHCSGFPRWCRLLLAPGASGSCSLMGMGGEPRHAHTHTSHKSMPSPCTLVLSLYLLVQCHCSPALFLAPSVVG